MNKIINNSPTVKITEALSFISAFAARSTLDKLFHHFYFRLRVD